MHSHVFDSNYKLFFILNCLICTWPTLSTFTWVVFGQSMVIQWETNLTSWSQSSMNNYWLYCITTTLWKRLFMCCDEAFGCSSSASSFLVVSWRQREAWLRSQPCRFLRWSAKTNLACPTFPRNAKKVAMLKKYAENRSFKWRYEFVEKVEHSKKEADATEKRWKTASAIAAQEGLDLSR